MRLAAAGLLLALAACTNPAEVRYACAVRFVWPDTTELVAFDTLASPEACVEAWNERLEADSLQGHPASPEALQMRSAR